MWKKEGILLALEARSKQTELFIFAAMLHMTCCIMNNPPILPSSLDIYFSALCVCVCIFFFILLCLHVCVMCSEKKTTHQCSRSWHNNGIFLIQNGDGMNHYRALNMTTQTFLFFYTKIALIHIYMKCPTSGCSSVCLK